jgi:hypothetical protein
MEKELRRLEDRMTRTLSEAVDQKLERALDQRLERILDQKLERILDRVSFENSFDLKQPKLEAKPVSALSETKRLFQLFRFYTETESFDVSIEPKQTEDQPKQFDKEHSLLFFAGNLGFFRCIGFFSIFSGFFGFLRFFRFFRFVSTQFVSVVLLL